MNEDSLLQIIREQAYNVELIEASEKQTETYITIGITMGALVIIPFIVWYRTRQWQSGIVPKNFRYNQTNLVEVLLGLGVNICKLQIEDFEHKKNYMGNFFQMKYPMADVNFRDSMQLLLSNPLKTRSICNWLLKHQKDTDERLNTLYFVVGLAMVDGELSPREHNYIYKLTKALHLKEKHFNSIIGMYQSNKKAKQKARQKKVAKKSVSKKEIYFKILEMKPTEDFSKIKKQYRTLVKEHHPDKFSTSSDLEQTLAKERFLKIQEAYEYFEVLFK